MSASGIRNVVEECIKTCSLLYHCKKCLGVTAKHLNQCLSPNEGNEIFNKNYGH